MERSRSEGGAKGSDSNYSLIKLIHAKHLKQYPAHTKHSYQIRYCLECARFCVLGALLLFFLKLLVILCSLCYLHVIGEETEAGRKEITY